MTVKIERGPRGYDYVFDSGAWVHIKRGQIWRNACCDCQLVHDIEIDTIPHGRGQKVVIKVERNDKETAALRKAKKKKK